jgi:flagellar hook-associated protein 3 FlgL
VINRMSSGQMARTYVSDLRGVYASLAESQQQVSTGKTMIRPSDDPVGIAISLGLRRDQAATDAWARNIQDSLTWLNTTDRALGQALEVVQRASELAVQGANGTLSVEARNRTADAVEGLKSQFVEVGNRSLGGRYLFAGTATTTRPFDPVTETATLPISTGQIAREVAQGSVVSVNTTADRLQGPGGATPDIFTALDDLATALRASDSAGIANGLVDFDAHLDNINMLRGEAGAKVNRLELTASRFEAQRVATGEQLSTLEGVDMAQAIITFTERENVYRAALAAGARISQPSLMDFLQ